MINYFKMFFIFLSVFFLISCLGQKKSIIAPIPDPDEEFFDFILPIKMDDITETADGAGSRNMPAWLRAYINGGIAETEKISEYNDKYMFIAMSEGLIFNAMSKWADNFSPVHDTIMLAARRIEKKIISSASLYPDDEYGKFFESIIKNAYSTAYPNAVKEDTYWIKMKTGENSEIYVFFVLISVDKNIMQKIIQEMIDNSIPPSSSLTRNQRNAVNRMQNNFFEGF